MSTNINIIHDDDEFLDNLVELLIHDCDIKID